MNTGGCDCWWLGLDVYNGGLVNIIEGKIEDAPKNIILMQFTGLKDKNGKEIYEGDIFTFTNGPRKTVAKVVFEEAMFKMKDNNGWGAMILQREGDMEVIGNIYENPELLK